MENHLTSEMNLTQEQLDEIKNYSKDLMTWKDIAYLMELDLIKFKAAIDVKKKALENETKEFLLRKNNKVMYWISNPKKTMWKISNAMFSAYKVG